MVRIARLALLSAAWLGSAVAAGSGPTLEEIVEVTDLSSLALSPDGQMLAFRAETPSIAANRIDLAWHVVPTDGSAPPRRIADAGEGNRPDGTLYSEPPLWSRDGTAIYYRKVADGEVQVWRARIDGAGEDKATHEAGNVTAFALAPTADRIVVAVGPARAEIARAEEDEYSDGIRIDARIDPARGLYRAARIDGRPASDRLRGGWFEYGGLLADRPLVYRSLALGEHNSVPATPSESALLVAPARPADVLADELVLAKSDGGPARGTLVLAADGLTGRLSVRRRSGATVLCNDPRCRRERMSTAAWLPRSDRIVFTTTGEATRQALHLWDIASGEVRSLAGGGRGRLNGGRDDLTGCALGERAAFCVAADADVPPHIVAIGYGPRSLRTLAAPNRALADRVATRFEVLSWRSPTRRRFTGRLLRPEGSAGAAPLFVTYYVCDGYLRGGTGDEYPLRALAAHGIAALCIDRSPTVPGPGDQVEQYRIAADAVVSAVDLLAARGLVDRARVGMGGVSFGGEAALWIAVHQNLLAAAAIANSALTPTYYWFNAMPGRNVPAMLERVWGIGDPDRDRAGWAALSPALRASDIETPLLMQLPEREFRLNIELAARPAREGGAVDLWAFAGAPHIKYEPRQKLAVYRRNLDWFRYWLKGEIDPAPDKREQYALWLSFARKPGWKDPVRSNGVGKSADPPLGIDDGKEPEEAVVAQRAIGS